MIKPNRNETIERIAKLRPIDDIFMYQVFKDNVPLTELLLCRIIGMQLSVRRVSVQYDIELHAVGARSLRLDVLATDVDGNVYDIEIQRDDRGAIPKRARYHSSVLDVAQLKQGEDFSKLHDTYLIFITEHDLWQDGEAVHIIERRDAKTGKAFGDGTHIIYVNGQYRAEDPIGVLMHDFLCEHPEDMLIPLMAETCGYLVPDCKNTKKEKKYENWIKRHLQTCSFDY